MEDRADAMCPTVGTVKKRPRPTFHLGHTSCVCDCIRTSLFYPFIYELSHAASYEDGVKSHQLGKGAVGFSWNPSFSLAPPTCRREHNLRRLGCENKNENTYTQSRGNKLRREESCCLEQHGLTVFSLTNFSAVLSLRHSYSPHNDVTVSPC